MRLEAEKRKAEKLFVHEGKNAPEIAKTLGVAKRTVYLWAEGGNWKDKRFNFLVKKNAAFENGAIEAAKEQGKSYVLSHIRRLELCAQFAEDQRVSLRDRLTAIRLSAELEGMQKLGDDEGPPTRFVVVDPGDESQDQAKQENESTTPTHVDGEVA